MFAKVKTAAKCVGAKALSGILVSPLAYQFTMFKLHPTDKRAKKAAKIVNWYADMMESIDPDSQAVMQINDLRSELNELVH